jgi:hypothetical protein
MSKVKKLTSYFKIVTKDEREVEELLATQLSRNSRTATIESAKTLSTLSSAVMSIVDLTDYSSDLLSPALNAIAEYESNNVRDDDEHEGEEVEFIGTVDKRNSGFVGDAVINALDTIISQTSPIFSNVQPNPHSQKLKRVTRKYNSTAVEI